MNKIKYKVFIPLFSYLPNSVLRFLDRHVPIDKEDIWSFWMDCSYHGYVREDMKNHPELGDDNQSLL